MTAQSQTAALTTTVDTRFLCPFCGQKQCQKLDVPLYARPKHYCSDCDRRYAIIPGPLDRDSRPQYTTDNIQVAINSYVSRLAYLRSIGKTDRRSSPLYLKYGARVYIYLIPIIVLLSWHGALQAPIAVIGTICLLVAFFVSNEFLAHIILQKQPNLETVRPTDGTQWMAYKDGRDARSVSCRSGSSREKTE